MRVGKVLFGFIAAGQTHQNTLAQMIESHTDLTKRVRRPKGLKAISQKLHRRKLAATIRRVHSAKPTSAGEATRLL